MIARAHAVREFEQPVHNHAGFHNGYEDCRNTTRTRGDFFFSSRRRHTRWPRDWSSDVCSSDLVLIGTISFLLLGKMPDGKSPLTLIDTLLPVYEALLAQLGRAGAVWVQMDEPCFVLDLPEDVRLTFRKVYQRLSGVAHAPQLLVTTYFGGLGDNTEVAASLPVSGIHVDLVRAPEQLEPLLKALPRNRFLSAGVVDGRNVWRTDLDAALGLLRRAADVVGPDHVLVAPSCSLLHCPVDLSLDKQLDPELHGWLSFATDKLRELKALGHALTTGDISSEDFARSRNAREGRRG